RLKPVVAVGDGLTGLITVNGTRYEPHIWFDVSLWTAATADAARRLVALDRAHAAYCRTNARRYAEALDSLGTWVQACTTIIPPTKRVLITAHEAFSHFGRAYGAELRGLQGISTVCELGLRDVSNLADYIMTYSIPAVFVESSVSDRSLKAVLTGVRQRGG